MAPHAQVTTNAELPDTLRWPLATIGEGLTCLAHLCGWGQPAAQVVPPDARLPAAPPVPAQRPAIREEFTPAGLWA